MVGGGRTTSPERQLPLRRATRRRRGVAGTLTLTLSLSLRLRLRLSLSLHLSLRLSPNQVWLARGVAVNKSGHEGAPLAP
jgi:hypothetical protein